MNHLPLISSESDILHEMDFTSRMKDFSNRKTRKTSKLHDCIIASADVYLTPFVLCEYLLVKLFCKEVVLCKGVV